MKRILLLFLLIGSFVYSQNLCEECVEQNGFYCGDDPANWTQYSPNGCVPNGLNGLFYLNDGWEDCVDASDEEDAVPTTLADCQPYVEPCDTVYVNTVDTVYVDVFIEVPEYVDCDTGLPCGQIGIQEVIEQSKKDDRMYNLLGQAIREPNGLYVEGGKVKYKLK